MDASDFANAAVNEAVARLSSCEVSIQIEDFDGAFVKEILDNVFGQMQKLGLAVKGIRISGDVQKKLSGIMQSNALYKSAAVAVTSNDFGVMTLVFIKK